MITAHSRARNTLLALLFVTCLAMQFIGAVATAQPSPAVSISTSSQVLRAAATVSAADRTLVSNARALEACQTKHPERCDATRRAVQRAGHRLAVGERRLAKVAHSSGIRAVASAAKQAPLLTVSGQTLHWTQPGDQDTFVLMRKVPGQEAQYSVIDGTSTTPPPVPGYAVRYSVRTNVRASTWSSTQSITYPAPALSSAPPPSAETLLSTPPVNLQTAPIIAVSGQALTWTQIGSVTTYVIMSKVPGQEAQYSTVSGTSTTPAAVPGVTVQYSVRTAVDGSVWAPDVSISYPSEPTTGGGPKTPEPPASAPEPPAQPPAQTPVETAASDPNFQPGLNSGTNMKEDLQGAALLGAKVVRVGWSIDTTPAGMEPVIAGYAAKGIRVQPLAEFYQTVPSPAEAQNLASWAKAYGPGGTFWAGRSDGQLAIGAIEFGNETSSQSQYGDAPGEPSFFARAQTYAIRFREAAEAIATTGTGVGLLAQDEDESGDWMSGMYSAVPNLSKYVAGWTIHPYGGEQYNRERLDALIAQTAERGASTVPIDITEWGVSTDNGDCVNFNEGFNLCMTYEEAAQTLKSSFAWMSKLLGARLGDFFLYQVRDQQPAGQSSNWQAYFGVLQHELQPKGAYTTAAEALLSS
jgi:hypothetical protein